MVLSKWSSLPFLLYCLSDKSFQSLGKVERVYYQRSDCAVILSFYLPPFIPQSFSFPLQYHVVFFSKSKSKGKK